MDAFLAIVALLAALAAGEGDSARAAAATPCWQQVLTDWADDGAITGAYQVACYRETLRRLPEDVRLYSSASDDIRRALAAHLHSTRGVSGVRTGAPQPQLAAGAAAGDGRLPTAPLVLAGALAAMGILVASALGVWHRRSRHRRAHTR